jgi:hypothetical protein
MKRFGALIVALVIWSLLSFGWLAVFGGGHMCRILQTVPTDGSPATLRPLTQAEMDAQIASCEAPRPGELLVVGVGYLVILVAGLYMTAGERGHELARATSTGLIGAAAATLALAVLVSYATSPPSRPPPPTPAEGYWCWQSLTSPAPHQSRLADEYPCSQEEVNYYIHGTGPSPLSSLGPTLPPATPAELPGT